MTHCPRCQSPLPQPPERFCPSCGADLQAPPPLVPGAAPAAPSGTPWEERDRLGLVPALFETAKQVLTSPTEFFRRMPTSGGIGAPLAYALIVGYLGYAVSAVYDALLRLVMGSVAAGLYRRGPWARTLPFVEGGFGLVFTLVLGPIFILIGLFIAAGLCHLMLLVLGGARRGFEATFRVTSYAHSASVFLLLPLCGGLIGFVAWIVVQIVGLAEAHGIGRGTAAAAVLVPLALLCCCCGAAIGLSVAGGLAALSHLGR